MKRALFIAVLALAPALASAQTPICAVQGTGSSSPLNGSRVTLTGVITADFTGTSLAGFYLQEPACDSDPNTSDAVWVAGRAAVIEGHRATVAGRITESFGQTTVELETVSDGGAYTGTVEALTVSPPAEAAAAAAYLEAREGMLVALPVSRVIAATDHFGEAYVAAEASGITRLFRGSTDGRKLGLSQPKAWLSLNQGDRVTQAVGPLGYTFGEFKVLLSSRAAVVERTGLAVPAAGAPTSLSVGTYNLENFFDTVDDAGKSDTVASAAEYAAAVARRARSIARYLGLPDVLGVEEVENLRVLEDLAVDPEMVPGGYRAGLVEGADARGIDVGILYRASRVTLLGLEARQGCVDASLSPGTGPCSTGAGNQLFARPPLVARFQRADTGERLAVIVNHFVSMSGDDATSPALRLAQAAHVRALVDELKAADGTGVVVVGDLNDFEDSAPVQRLTVDGALVDTHRLGPSGSYTYSFQGLAQTLDYVLVDAGLASRVTSAGARHVNVDFGAPAPGAAADASPRTSDHDPVLVVLR